MAKYKALMFVVTSFQCKILLIIILQEEKVWSVWCNDERQVSNTKYWKLETKSKFVGRIYTCVCILCVRNFHPIGMAVVPIIKAAGCK